MRFRFKLLGAVTKRDDMTCWMRDAVPYRGAHKVHAEGDPIATGRVGCTQTRNTGGHSTTIPQQWSKCRSDLREGSQTVLALFVAMCLRHTGIITLDIFSSGVRGATYTKTLTQQSESQSLYTSDASALPISSLTVHRE